MVSETELLQLQFGVCACLVHAWVLCKRTSCGSGWNVGFVLQSLKILFFLFSNTFVSPAAIYRLVGWFGV